MFAGWLSRRNGTEKLRPPALRQLARPGWRPRPVLSQEQDQFVERFARFGGDLDSGETLVRPFFANLNFGNLEIRAVGQNLIQHFRQNERIDNVPP